MLAYVNVARREREREQIQDQALPVCVWNNASYVGT